MITRNRPKARPAASAALAALALAGGLVTATPAAAAVTCNAPVWKAQYYANTTFSGTPKLTACDSAVAENYGYGDPAGVALPKDNFSVRWSLTRDFGSGGPFTFSAEAQDGIRVYLDGVRKIDLWRNVSTTQKRTVNLTVPAGRHSLRVDFAAWTGAANVKFGYGPRTSASVDTVRPLAPAGLSASLDRNSGRATLRWAANKEMDLAGYRVYRRTGTAGWAQVSGTALRTGTSFVEMPPETGASYVYEVRAVDRAGRESLGSADATVVSVDRTAPSAPGGVTATDGAAGIALAWQPVPGAAKYLVHRQRAGTSDAGTPAPLVQVATVTAPSWTDPDVTERTGYTYWVSAVDAAGNTSPRTTLPTAHGDYAPGAPTGLTATFVPQRGIDLTWTAPADTDVVSYNVYRNGHLSRDGVSGRTYRDLSVDNGTTYTYTVTAVDRAGHESPVSAAASATTEGDLVPPAAVTGLKATPREDGILLEWDANTEPDLLRYDLYRGEWIPDEESPGGGIWLFRQVEWIGKDATSHLYPATPDGETSAYALAAVDVWGNTLATDIDQVSRVEVTELGTPATG
ncbi:PA14 domain-containing protein [Streptomyces sp. NPDC046374]|uniref:PA14 domain-containing protein n=1 Tax=Streptomyces sp. NPDC046374 TaxID=3154917 RepID=UPI0033D03FC1